MKKLPANLIECLEDVTREELTDIVTQHNKLFNL